jgi:hypothetical protein
MTHDELLIEILRRLDVAYYNGDPQSMNALRAVVELHKPTSPKQIGTGYVGDRDMCSQCKSYYPCPTIQAIEKELV